MKLIQKPSESLFIISLNEEIEKIDELDLKNYIHNQIYDYEKEIENLYYKKSDRSTFPFVVKIDNYKKSLESE